MNVQSIRVNQVILIEVGKMAFEQAAAEQQAVLKCHHIDCKLYRSSMSVCACVQTIMANQVILNLATRPLHRLLQNSKLPSVTSVNPQLEAPYVNRATKLYLYYDHAWWLQAGLNNGSLQYVDQQWPPVDVPIIGRSEHLYHSCIYLKISVHNFQTSDRHIAVSLELDS